MSGGRFSSGESGEVGKINSRRVTTGALPYPAGSLLGRLSDRTRENFLSVGVSEGRPNGATIISQGEADSSALLLLHGSVKVLATDPAGERTLLGIRVGGDLVGEMAALDVGPRSATVISCTDILFKRITRAELRNFLARHHGKDGAFDVVTVYFSLIASMSTAEIKDFIRGFYGLLKPGGLFVFATVPVPGENKQIKWMGKPIVVSSLESKENVDWIKEVGFQVEHEAVSVFMPKSAEVGICKAEEVWEEPHLFVYAKKPKSS